MRNKIQRGVALVEFALILPFLLLLSLITVEFGRAIWQYNTLTKSVRDAARYLSLQTPGTKMAQAKNLVVYGNLAGTGAPLARGHIQRARSRVADRRHDARDQHGDDPGQWVHLPVDVRQHRVRRGLRADHLR